MNSEEWKKMSDEFCRWEKMSRDTIDVKRCYIDIAGDLVAGILLSQIIYWHLPNKDGGVKLRVKLRGVLCLAKNRTDWWNECRITPRQYDRAIEVLKKKDLVSVKNSMFNGKRTPHIRLNFPILIKAMSEAVSGW
jgi:hypothetical protein